MQTSFTLWGGFIAFLILAVFIDLKVLHRDGAHKIGMKESLIQTAGWFVLAMLFGVGLFLFLGHQLAIEYFTGYLIEYSLSVDNIFVFILIFSYFGVPEELEYEILFYGVLGALVFRLAFVLVGAALLENFFWVSYVLGAFLIYTGFKLAAEGDKDINPEQNPVLKITKKFMPVTDDFQEDHFFIKQAGKRLATPMFIVLLVIETSDIVFALDSIPAILSITQDQFIAFAATAFAALGLRALFFALSAIVDMFHYLHYGLAVILIFVGIKMVISEFYHIPTLYALGFIILTLAIAVVASLLFPPKDAEISNA